MLDELHGAYPTFGIGRHLSTALSDYGDPWGMTDKEILFALKKYQEELSLDIQQVASEDYVKKIVEDAADLTHILDSEDDEEEDI